MIDIQTTRLHIKPFVLPEAASFFEMTQDSGFNAFPITQYRQKSVASSEQWIMNELAAHRTYGFGKVGLWLKELTATITLDNLPSIKLAERLGMTFDCRIMLKGVETNLYRLPRERFTI
jgi:hypothetical protein